MLKPLFDIPITPILCEAQLMKLLIRRKKRLDDDEEEE